MRRFIGLLFFILIAAAPALTHAQAQREVVDRIVAVVGNEVILATELANQLQVVAFQTGRRPSSEREIKAFRDEVLEQMISDRLFLIEARKDTSVSVRPEEVEQALDEQVMRVSERFGSPEEFAAALNKEGLTVRDLRRKYRMEIENQLLKQRLIGKKLMSVSVSKHEVAEFYRNFKDSIPSQPEAARLAHILIPIEPSQKAEDSVRQFAEQLRKRALGGADFATLSSQYSSMGAGVNGGDLGFVGREDLVPEFARAAFALGEGEISGVIRTEYGYHIVKNEGRRDDKLRLRHVLLAVQPSSDDTTRAFRLADSLLTVAMDGGNFEELAKTFSRDDQTRAQGGELGWFAVNEMPPEFMDAVTGWSTPGEYKGPIVSRSGIHVLKLLDQQDAKTYSLDQDFDRIKELARQDKTGRLVDKWIETLKDQTYIEYRLDEIDAAG